MTKNTWLLIAFIINNSVIAMVFNGSMIEHAAIIDYQPLSPQDVKAAWKFVKKGVTDQKKQKIFHFLDENQLSHKIVYYGGRKGNSPRVSDDTAANLKIFAIDDEKAFDFGTNTEIRMAEKISAQMLHDRMFYSGEIVAVKIIRKNVVKELLQDFHNEINILKFMGDYHGHFVDDEYEYLFSTFVPGENLEALLKKDLSDSERESIAVAVILAIHKLHQEKFIIHNDIKSGNIKIEHVGDQYTARFVDFGHACTIFNPKYEMLGSPGYRDVRLRCGEDRNLCSLQSDYYAGGVTIFEILEPVENNFQNYIKNMKKSSINSEWDLENKGDFVKAFTSSFDQITVDNASPLRQELIKLAIKFTDERHHQVEPSYVTNWLRKLDIELQDNFVIAEYLLERSKIAFTSKWRGSITPTSSEELRDSRPSSRKKLMKALPLKGILSGTGPSSLRSTSSSGTLRGTRLSVSEGASDHESSTSRGTTSTTAPSSPGRSFCGSASGSLSPSIKVHDVESSPRDGSISPPLRGSRSSRKHNDG